MAKRKKHQPRISIRLKSFDHKMIEGAARRITEAAQRTGSDVAGPVTLPADVSKHTGKDSREQFQIRTYKRLINVLGPTPKTIDALTRLNLPVGVDIEIKLVSADRKPPSAPQLQVPARRVDVADMVTPDPVTPTRSSLGSKPTEPGTGEGRRDSTGANVDGESGPTNEAPQVETGQEPGPPDERRDVGGQPVLDTPGPEQPDRNTVSPGLVPTRLSSGPKPREPGVSEGKRGDTGTNAYSGNRAKTDQETGSPTHTETDESGEPFAKEFFESQTITPSDAYDSPVALSPDGPKTGESARRHTHQSAQFGRTGAPATKTVRRWQPTEAAKKLADEFRSMVQGDYGRRCQICGTTFKMSNGELQVFVVHIVIVPPRGDHRTNHFGNLVGLCGWHYALVQYGEWALLNPETDEPFGGWEYMQDFVLNASEEMEDEGNPYIGLPVRFWNVYQGWESTPSSVDEEIRYSIPHWTYLRKLLST